MLQIYIRQIKTNTQIILSVCFFVLLSLSVTNAMAARKALIVTVGQYQNNISSLPGAIADRENSQKIAALLGYSTEEIKVLSETDASYEGVVEAFDSWLIDSKQPLDEVFIYFSVHGSRIPDLNNDEADKADEVLLMADAAERSANGARTLVNVITDDQLNQFLQKIPSDNTLLVIDACHSGTAHKAAFGTPSLPSQFRYKNHIYSNMPESSAKPVHQSKGFSWRKVMQWQDESNDNYIALSASADDERAVSGKQGSLFTLALLNKLQKAKLNNISISFDDLVMQTRDYIHEFLSPDYMSAIHRPQLGGDIQRAKSEKITIF